MTEIFLHFRYGTKFKRRRGWKTLPIQGTRFVMSQIFEWRKVGIIATGDPEDMEQLQQKYRFEIRWGRQKRNLVILPIQAALRDTHSRVLISPITPALRFKKRQVVWIEMEGEPFKTRAPITVEIILEGVQVFYAERIAA